VEPVLNRLIGIVSRLGHWGYLVIFLAVTLESAAFLGFVVPGETLVLLGGFLAAQGTLDWGDLMVLVCIGAVLGDSIGYEVGRRLGPQGLLRFGRWFRLSQKHLEHVEEFFRRHGGKAVFLGRFTALLRALTPFVAGSSGMPYSRFFLYNAAGGIVWGVGFVVLGYFVGASWRVVEHWIGEAGAVIGGLLAVVLALAWVWRWLVRHEVDVVDRWARFLSQPRVAALRRRFTPQIAFLQARLTPGGYLGLYLTVGALVIVAAAWVFGGIAQDVIAGDPLTVVDMRFAIWLHGHTAPRLTAAMLAISSLGSPVAVGALSLLMAAVLISQRSWRRLLSVVLTVPGGGLLNMVLKQIFHRPRPAFDHPLARLTSHGFPSGHATAAVLFYGLLAVFAVQTVRSWRWRILAVLGALLLIMLIGFSRLYLGVHYLSDVLAADAEGVAWLAVCLTAVETLRQLHASREDGAKERPEPFLS